MPPGGPWFAQGLDARASCRHRVDGHRALSQRRRELAGAPDGLSPGIPLRVTWEVREEVTIVGGSALERPPALSLALCLPSPLDPRAGSSPEASWEGGPLLMNKLLSLLIARPGLGGSRELEFGKQPLIEWRG